MEGKYKELLMGCSTLHVKIKDDEVRKDLESVENYYRKLSPVFTAAGFFQLNQGLFSTFCSAIVSYLIIIIQFKNGNIGVSYTNSSNILHENLSYIGPV